jgi:hypothetical protein
MSEDISSARRLPCHNADGSLKRRYETRAEAKRAVKATLQRGNEHTRPYRCETCGWYHLSKPSRLRGVA